MTEESRTAPESPVAVAAELFEAREIIAWWGVSYMRQVRRLREALSLLGIENPVNYTGEVKNFAAEALEAALREVAAVLSPIPTHKGACEGCTAEMAEAVRISQLALSSEDATRPTGDKEREA